MPHLAAAAAARSAPSTIEVRRRRQQQQQQHATWNNINLEAEELDCHERQAMYQRVSYHLGAQEQCQHGTQVRRGMSCHDVRSAQQQLFLLQQHQQQQRLRQLQQQQQQDQGLSLRSRLRLCWKGAQRSLYLCAVCCVKCIGPV